MLSPLTETQMAEMQAVTGKIQAVIFRECQKLVESMPQYAFDLKSQHVTLVVDYATLPAGAKWPVRVPANEASFHLTVTRKSEQPAPPVIPCA